MWIIQIVSFYKNAMECIITNFVRVRFQGQISAIKNSDWSKCRKLLLGLQKNKQKKNKEYGITKESGLLQKP